MQVSVKPQAAAIPAAVLTMHRYLEKEKGNTGEKEKLASTKN